MDDPRAARERRAQQRIPLWLGPIFALIGIASAAMGLAVLRDEVRLATDGRAAIATVAGKTTASGAEGDTTYRLVYRFTTPEGRRIQGTTDVPARTYALARVGDRLAITYVASEPEVNRPGDGEARPFPGVLVVAFGGLFLIVGISLAVGAVGGRRSDAALGSRPWPQAMPDRTGTYRFDRTLGQWFTAVAGPPIGAVLVALFGLYAATIPGGAGVVLFAIVFFALMVAWGWSSRRRGLRRAILTVGPQGIWTPESGLLPWTAVRDVRLETTTGGRGRVRQAPAGGRRLGIRPAMPVERPFVHRPVTWLGVTAQDEPAPYGIHEFELEVPFETVIPAIARYAPVLDAAGRPLRAEDAARWPDVPAWSRDAGPGPTGPSEDPAETRTREFARRRGVALGGVLQLVQALAFAAVPLVVGSMFIGAVLQGAPPIYGLVAVAMLTLFLGAAFSLLLSAIDHIAVGLGPSVVLTVGPAGIAIRGRRAIPWAMVAAIRLGDVGLMSSDEDHGSARQAPRLIVVPRDIERTRDAGAIERSRDALRRLGARLRLHPDPGRLAPAVGLDLDVLEADPDAVIDLVDGFRRVTTEGR